MSTVKLIDCKKVAALAGKKDPNFAYTKQRNDATFPRQVSGGTGIGLGKALWEEPAIKAWLILWNSQRRKQDCHTSTLDNEMARQVICRGWQRGSRAIYQQQSKKVSAC